LLRSLLKSRILCVSKYLYVSRAWWGTSVISALGRQIQEDQELETSLGYTMRPDLKKARAGVGGRVLTGFEAYHFNNNSKTAKK
jgi:hypothetical protein